MDRNKLSLKPPHLGVASGASKVIFEPMVHLAQTMHQTDRNELPLEPHHLGVPSGVSKMIFEPIVCLAQTVELSNTDTNTVSKWTDARFHMIHDT
jgi:hypothetical protein